MWEPIDQIAVALYPFAANGEHQISLNMGDTLQIEEQSGEWYRGTLLGTTKRGIFPARYVAFKSFSDSYYHEDAIVVELTRTLREWGMLLKTFFQAGQYAEYNQLKERLSVLVGWRRALTSESSTEKQKAKLRTLATNKIEEGRRALGLDVVPQLENGDEADESNCSIIGLHAAHIKAAIAEASASRELLNKARSRNNAESYEELPPACHILLHVKAFICSVGENTELFFSLYDAEKRAFLTENFHVPLTRMGMPHDEDKIGRLRTVFYDLDEEDVVDRQIYLVCRICRDGCMLYDEQSATPSTSKGGGTFRRPFGYGVLLLTPGMLNEREHDLDTEHFMPIFSANSESLFANLHENIITDAGGYHEVPRAKGVCVGIKMFRGDWDAVTEARGEECQRVPVTRTLHFRDLVCAEERNDLYVRIDTGEFLKDMKKAAKNIQVTVQLLNDSGEPVAETVTMGSGEAPDSSYQSLVLYHDNKPVWSEYVKLSVPPELFDSTHMYITFSHCSTSSSKSDKAFSFAFMKLINADGTVVQDGNHTLTTYKMPPKKSQSNTAYYLQGGEYPGGVKMIARKETFQLATALVSTQLTQNERLLSLLRWQDCPASKISTMVEGVTFVPHSEIVKFLADVFDALFAVMEEYQADKQILMTTVDCIVWLINILVEAKSAKMRKCRIVLDEYINEMFTSKSAHILLSNALSDTMANVATAKPKQINSAIKGLPYMFKFIARSRDACVAAGEALDDSTIPQGLGAMFAACNGMMGLTQPAWIIGSQTLLVKYFTAIIAELTSMFRTEVVARLVCSFVDSIVYDESKKQLNNEKLLLMNALCQEDLDDAARDVALPSVISQLKIHLNKSSEEAQLCVLIVSDIIDKITSDVSAGVDGAVLFELIQMLRPIVNAFRSLSPQTELGLKMDVATVILALFYYMEEGQFSEHIDSMRSDREKTEFLREVVDVLLRMVEKPTYPANWAVMRMIQLKVVSKALICYSSAFQSQFSKRAAFDFEGWSAVLTVVIRFIGVPDLRIEDMSATKRVAVTAKYGDLRLPAVELAHELWACIPRGHQGSFINPWMGDVLSLAMITKEDVRALAVALYFDMMCQEYESAGSFTQSNHTTIDVLDLLIRDASVETVLSSFFDTLIVMMNQSSGALAAAGLEFLDEMKQMVGLLTELRSLPDGPEYEDDRAIATMRLADYLKSTGRHEAYFKYVHQLKDLHVVGQNFTEAGHALLLHAGLLDWDLTRHCDAAFDIPAGTEFSQKEALYVSAIGYFDVGKNWEGAIRLCRELCTQYETKTYDYPKLAGMLKMLAGLYNKVVTEERFYCEYFRTAYYGNGFPITLKNKEFVYRGNELERIGDFMTRLKDKFPAATILMANSPPEDDVVNSSGQYIQVALIDPVSGYTPTALDGVALHPFIKSYYRVNEVSQFSFSRRINKVPKNRDNEFATLWTLQTIIETEDSFPTIHRRLEVVRRTEVEKSPITNALESVKEKSESLLAMYNDALARGSAPNSYTMALNGTIDAAVNGGTKQYLDAFLTPEYKRSNPADSHLIEELRVDILNQVQLLEDMLVLHAKVVSPEMRGLHEHLEGFFPKTKADMLTYLQ